MIASVSVLPDYIQRIYTAYTQKPPKPTVVVVGYGWAGASFASALDTSKYTLRVISSRPKRLNQPEMIHDLKSTYKLPPPSLTITEDECVSVEDNKVIGKKAGYTYDFLVIAAGGESNDFNIPGVKDHCIQFKSEQQLAEVKALMSRNERITIVGAGPTGIELAFKLKQETTGPIEVIEASPSILPGFHDSLRTEVLRRMKEKGIQLYTNQKIRCIEDTEGSDIKVLYTTQKQFSTSGKPIWTCGIRPSNLILCISPTATPDSHLQINSRIYAIGDSIRGHGPPTAQNAEQQGRYLAKYFNSKFTSTKPYKFQEFARVLDLSDDGLLIEKNGYVITLPSAARKIFYALID